MMLSVVPTDVPEPLVLLGIQAGGGVLAFLAIQRLVKFATLDGRLHRRMQQLAGLNVLTSVILLLVVWGEISPFFDWVEKFGRLELCRTAILSDTAMLGTLLYFTGGAEESIFAPQFAAVLSLAVLLPDSSRWKWTYAFCFLVAALYTTLNRAPEPLFQGYNRGEPGKLSEKTMWSVIFLFVLTIFPVTYSIQADAARAARDARPAQGPSEGNGGHEAPTSR